MHREIVKLQFGVTHARKHAHPHTAHTHTHILMIMLRNYIKHLQIKEMTERSKK